MSKKAFVPPRLAPLQRVVAEIVTDPAELAAMDEIRKQQKRKLREKEKIRNRKRAKTTSKSAAKRKA